MEGPRGLAGTTHPSTPDRLDRPFGDPLVGRLFPPLATGVHWGLERTERALDALGDPHRRYPVIHVGGTNGKGSVVTTVASVLNAGGVRSGCFTSPHLCAFRERIRVAGRELSDDTLLTYAEEVRGPVLRFGLTFFEAVTVLGFHAFAREGVEAAVVEVGLGGRFDATNVVRPEVAAVTNVALDHSEYLGNTREEIAFEKAGIMKAGVPFLTAETDPAIVRLMRMWAGERGVPFTLVDPLSEVEDLEVTSHHTSLVVRTDPWGLMPIRTPLVGRHQAANTVLAVRILEALGPELRPDEAAVRRGVSEVVHPGRDQVEWLDGKAWLFDVAHNTAGILSLVDTLDRLDLPRPLVALVGVLGDKDWRAMLPPLFSRMDFALLTQPPSAPPERRWDPREAADAVAHLCPMRLAPDFTDALERARAEAGEGTVVVTGSVHTVGSALKLLGRAPTGR